MRFVTRPLAQARGHMLAQTIQAGPERLRKGITLTGLMCQWLAAAGYKEVAVAELSPEDLSENEAAHAIARSLITSGLAVEVPVNGRCNLIAAAEGLFRADARRVARLNLLSEAITLATLTDRKPVCTGQVVATIKIMPMAVEAALLRHAASLAATGLCGLAAYKPRLCASILTRSPLRKESILRKTESAMETRVAARGGTALPAQFCAHEAPSLAAEIIKAQEYGADLILIAGAAAVADREDVAPLAVKLAGGEITRFGMPVFPGNLVCLGRAGTADVLVLPGCAGNLRLNGADWILDRLFTGEQVSAEDVALMGTGGLIEADSPAANPTRDALRTEG